MQLLEFEAKKLLSNVAIRIPKGELIDDSYQFKGEVILKVQAPTGKRKKQGGIVKVTNKSDLQDIFAYLQNLEIDGHRSEAVLAEEIVRFTQEHYFSLLVDSSNENIRLLARVKGGIDVEDVQDIVLSEIVTPENIDRIADSLRKFYGYLHHAFECMVANDILLLEINPLVMVDKTLVALDCKMEIDDSALFRHTELANRKTDANFVMLNANGDTAIVANGAGLAMATVDQVSQAGLTATNFLDIGGGADAETITKQFARLAELPNLKTIIVNVFAGITRCDQVAEAIVEARRKIDNLPPLFIRLHGTNYDEAKALLDKDGVGLFKSLHNCIEAAKNV
jgi:succinyl-CoA synthetase beta subunit